MAADLYPLRQQLSSDSKELLEAAMDAEVRRLEALRLEAYYLHAGAEFFENLDRRIEHAKQARRQLAYVYVDQFPKGRDENDRAGRFGLGA